MDDTEEFDADSFKSKMIMVTAQLIYTVLTLIPVKVLYGNFVISVLYMGVIFGWCIYQGANSYFQDFLERYHCNLKIDQSIQKSIVFDFNAIVFVCLIKLRIENSMADRFQKVIKFYLHAFFMPDSDASLIF